MAGYHDVKRLRFDGSHEVSRTWGILEIDSLKHSEMFLRT
jgi:hypothetical protein